VFVNSRARPVVLDDTNMNKICRLTTFIEEIDSPVYIQTNKNGREIDLSLTVQVQA